MISTSEIEERFLRALEALPAHEAKRSGLPQRAHTFAFKVFFAKLNDLPRAQQTRKRDGVKREAQKLAEQSSKLRSLILEAHGDTFAALGSAGLKDPHPLLIADSLRALIQAAVTVIEGNENRSEKIGRPSSKAAEMIADFAVHHFEEVTMRQAAITVRSDREGNPAAGQFLAFLREIFEASGISASAEFHGKRAIARARAGISPGGTGGLVTIRHVQPKAKTPR